MTLLGRLIKPPLPDPTLDPFRGGVGVLVQGGVVAGHLVSTLTELWSPFSPSRRQWWVWFIIVWADGGREQPTEDYPPWSYVDEMKHGYLAWDERDASRDGRYEFAWLSDAQAQAARLRLAITPADF